MRFKNDATNPTENTSKFFVKHENGTKEEYVSEFFVTRKNGTDDFINYIKKQVIMKRAFGEVTLLIITTLISTGILQSVYH